MSGKTEAEKAAWLDGFKAATESAASFVVRVGSDEVDQSLNIGASMVAAMLQGALACYTAK